MKNENSYKTLTKFKRKNKKVGKIFILFVFACLFGSIIFISSVISNFLCIKNWGLFVNSVSIPTVNLYCIAVGEFENENLALTQSELIKEKGGAGYIYKNNQTFTVLVSGYLDKKTCQDVIEKNNLIVENLTCLEITISKTHIAHNRAKSEVSNLTDICNIALNTFKKLQEISNGFDSGELSSNQTYNQLFDLSYQIDAVISNFKTQSLLTSSENYDLLLSRAKNIFSKINNLILKTSKQQLSSEIKYCALDVMFVNASWHFFSFNISY